MCKDQVRYKSEFSALVLVSTNLGPEYEEVMLEILGKFSIFSNQTKTKLCTENGVFQSIYLLQKLHVEQEFLSISKTVKTTAS